MMEDEYCMQIHIPLLSHCYKYLYLDQLFAIPIYNENAQ